MTLHGEGTEESLEKAIDWLQRAAAGGYGYAALTLADIHSGRYGHKVDEEKARWWYDEYERWNKEEKKSVDGIAGQLEIVRLGPGDEECLRAIRLRALKDAPAAFGTTYEEAVTWPSERWEQQLELFATFVARAGRVELGMVRGAKDDQLLDAGYLISMWVAPEVRRFGIGSALVGAVEEWARRQRFSRLLLDVVETEVPAVAFYAAQGFTRTGKVGSMPPPREHVREIQMVKEF